MYVCLCTCGFVFGELVIWMRFWWSTTALRALLWLLKFSPPYYGGIGFIQENFILIDNIKDHICFGFLVDNSILFRIAQLLLSSFSRDQATLDNFYVPYARDKTVVDLFHSSLFCLWSIREGGLFKKAVYSRRQSI